MNIKHYPIFDIDKTTKYLSNRDGVELNYVCTSAKGGEAFAGDIYYRATPHPTFGNRYVSVFKNNGPIMLMGADLIENTTFGMIKNGDEWEYSQHRHDFRQVGNYAIDGGRAYVRLVGSNIPDVTTMRVKDGKFEAIPEETSDNTE